MSRFGFVLGSSLFVVAPLLAGACSNTADDCHATSTCPSGTSGSAGSSSGAAGDGNAGSISGGGGQGGTTAPGSAGDAGAGSGGEAGGAALPCDGACTTDKPVCLTATDTCVQCDSEDDCTGADKTRCDAATNTCVQCTETTDCTSPDAARCDAGTCAECETNADCAHITGKNVCDTDAGKCVECTGTDFESCGTDAGTQLVCDSLSNTCTNHKAASAGLCQPCVTDAQCAPGELCVLQKFQDQDVGYFCFWKQGAGEGNAPTDCTVTGRPYFAILANQTSIDGATADVCGMRASTCIARNQYSDKDCATGGAADDSKCGFAPGQDSKCVKVGSAQFRCTTACLGNDDCLPNIACDGAAATPVCKL